MKLLYASEKVLNIELSTWQSWHTIRAYPVPSFVKNILLRIEQRSAQSRHEWDSTPNRSIAIALRTRVHCAVQVESDSSESAIHNFCIAGLTGDLQKLGYARPSTTGPTVFGNPTKEYPENLRRSLEEAETCQKYKSVQNK